MFRADVARINRLPSGESFVLSVPKSYALFTQAPAEIDFLIVDQRGKIEQTDIEILHHASGSLNLFESGLQGFGNPIMFEACTCYTLIGGHDHSARPLNARRQPAQFVIKRR